MFDLMCFLGFGVGCGWVCVAVSWCCREVWLGKRGKKKKIIIIL
jgi:hypothetical protein